MPTRLHRYYGAGYLHFTTTVVIAVMRQLVLEPEQWAWSSFRHYGYDERGVLLVNEIQRPKLRIRKIS